ncbi:winged helix-turn-helix transcriptional regulator [Priestia koreensis]|uniref:winged helix-turn-helix transcriptional regulator n=1 Tax=Priestia koreensis TaxID=284581 RepID=UPI001F5AC312|nr:helix-turn-helix domain-containing protein [Priestia koreensis]MCM3004220.1 helix-turn-helix transcriptional regulator [Priestia koreensis]
MAADLNHYPILTEEEEQDISCSVEEVINVLGGKWSFHVLKELFDGTRRFGEIRKSIKGISPKALTDTLRHFEDNGIVEREIHATVPVTVEYSLTDKGASLNLVLREMKIWGSKWSVK